MTKNLTKRYQESSGNGEVSALLGRSLLAELRFDGQGEECALLRFIATRRGVGGRGRAL